MLGPVGSPALGTQSPRFEATEFTEEVQKLHVFLRLILQGQYEEIGGDGEYPQKKYRWAGSWKAGK